MSLFMCFYYGVMKVVLELNWYLKGKFKVCMPYLKIEIYWATEEGKLRCV